MSLSTLSTVTVNEGCCTDVKLEQFTYEWVIKNFEFLPQKNEKFINLPNVHTIINNVKYNILLFPRGYRKEDTDYVSIYLFPLSRNDGNDKIPVKAVFSVFPIGITETAHVLDTGKKIYGIHRLVRRSELLDSCASDKTVTIRCRIDISGETITKPNDMAKRMDEAFDSQGGQLSQAFRPLFKESKFSDVTVIVGTQTFPAHKVVLAARSSVFSAMFEHKGTQENVKNEVKIEQMEPAIVEAMLEFFYTDEVMNLEELALGLLEAADRYDIERLRCMCEKILYKKLNEENAAEILVYADLHHSYKLKEYVMEFIDDHLFDVIESKSYEEMKEGSHALLQELIRSIAVRRKSKE